MRTRQATPRLRWLTALATLALLCGGALAGPTGASANPPWAPAGTLAEKRAQGTATVLQDGRVLVVGGYRGGPYSNTTSADIYNPATNGWSPTAPPPTPSAQRAATLLPDGSVLVIGGASPFCCGGIASVDRYYPTTGSWANVASLGSGRVGHTATLLNNGKVLVTGGTGGTNSPSQPAPRYKTAEIYDPVANAWSPAAPMAVERGGHAAARLADGRVLVVGGVLGNSGQQTAEMYNPETNSWGQAGTIATARSGAVATVLQNGQVLLTGGANSEGAAIAAAERYTPASNSWSGAGALTIARVGHTATILHNGEVLVTGGLVNLSSVPLTAAERYNPASNSWVAAPFMDQPRAGHMAALVNGKVLVIGGATGSDITNTAEIYNEPPAGASCFVQTSKCVSGPFLSYWQAHGELAINGFPLSEPFAERLENGQVYLVQYFERVRMEYHPEFAAPNDVLLGQFGRRIHPADPGVGPKPGARFFTETGHNVDGGFLAYWVANGGLPQFGYPLTEVIAETLEDGKVYQVQYFERARFEYHSENPAPYDVLLGQFGRRILAGR